MRKTTNENGQRVGKRGLILKKNHYYLVIGSHNKHDHNQDDEVREAYHTHKKRISCFVELG
jgi:hypothetical protein